MGPQDGGIDEQTRDFAEFGVVGEALEELAEAAAVDPAAEAVVDGVPGAEVAGEIAPGDAGAGEVKEGFEELAIRETGLGAAGVQPGRLEPGFEQSPHGVGNHGAHGVLPRGKIRLRSIAD